MLFQRLCSDLSTSTPYVGLIYFFIAFSSCKIRNLLMLLCIWHVVRDVSHRDKQFLYAQWEWHSLLIHFWQLLWYHPQKAKDPCWWSDFVLYDGLYKVYCAVSFMFSMLWRQFARSCQKLTSSLYFFLWAFSRISSSFCRRVGSSQIFISLSH